MTTSKAYLCLLFLLFYGFLEAQTDTTTEKKEVFIVVDEIPRPKNGMEGFYQWFSKNVKYPKEAKKKGIQGKVNVQLIVDVDGSLINFKIINGIGGGCDEETLRVLSKAEKWIPGKVKGKPVKCNLKLPFIFRLE